METTLRSPLASLPDPLPIPTPHAPPRLALRPPGSKSLTNRALLLAGLADGVSTLRNPLTDADDAQRMIAALRTLGAVVEHNQSDNSLEIRGVAGCWSVPRTGVELDLQNAGTATRFLAAAAALSAGPITIDGNARMRERPIGELAAVLPALGITVEYLLRHGYPPLKLTPQSPLPNRGISIELLTTKSSQFISALLMIGPWLRAGITIRLQDEITSRPYIAMTLRLLDRLGATVRASESFRVLRVGPAAGGTPGLHAFDYEVEPDASGATYFWAAGAIMPGASVGIEGLSPGSLQGDALFPELLARMGAKHELDPRGITRVRGPIRLQPIDADLADMPDTAMTLAAVCAFAPGRSVLRGLRTLRVKETDRIAAMQNELRKVGVRVESDVEEDPNALSITPPEGGIDCSPGCPRVEFDTYDDHRMAMSMALIGLRRPNCFIRNPACVRKTYPTFWSDFSALS
ncbi:MAG: 3-phosphoshikimate 1-carboxyvinyltransferase [Phycisphaerales bacterium]|nr:3-phosphoshikimate 1-carboxyvinyltransferase [Phycisphaerales bacterium]